MKGKIRSLTDLAGLIRKIKPMPIPLKIGLTQESEVVIARCNRDFPGLFSALTKQESDDFILLSSVIARFPDLFSVKRKSSLPDKKTLESLTNLHNQYKCFRTYVSAFGLFFRYEEKNKSRLLTEVQELVKRKKLQADLSEGFLVDDFPIEACAVPSGKKLGILDDLIYDLEKNTEHGVDYIFHKQTGQFICPIHVDLKILEARLSKLDIKNKEEKEGKPKQKEEKSIVELRAENLFNLPSGSKGGVEPSSSEEITDHVEAGQLLKIKYRNQIPYMVFLGSKVTDPVFGFGRVFTRSIAENILYGTDAYGKEGQANIKAFYEEEAREENLRHTNNMPLHKGVVYSTTRYEELYERSAKFEKNLFPPLKFIPSVEHFIDTKPSPSVGGKTLKELCMEDIILLFPAKELFILKLAIGRAILGVSGSREYLNKDFLIEHDWRKAVITVGLPKIGKSTIIEGLSDALEYCGFTVASGVNFSERFNVGKSVLSDLSVFDDLTESRLVDNLKAENFKSAISGGRFNVEDKNIDKKDVKSKTVLIGNINDWTPQSLYDIDSGAKNRFVAISAFEARDGLNPWEMVRRVTKEMGVSALAVWVRLLRDCLDTALPYCYVNKEYPEAGISINNCIDNLALSNTNYFDSSPGVTFLCLALISHFYQLNDDKEVQRCVDEGSQGIRESPLFYDSIMSLYHFIHEGDRQKFINAVSEHWESCDLKVAHHPFIGLRELRLKSLLHAKREIHDIRTSPSYTPEDLVEENIAQVISLVKNKKGFIRKSFKGISQDWTIIFESKTKIQFLINTANGLSRF